MNSAHLIGRLGADPEIRQSRGGTTIANFSLATNHREKQGDEWVDATAWHRIVAFGKTAELVERYLTKGRQVAVEGRISYRQWEDREGQTRHTTEIVADRVHFLGSKDEGQSRGGYGGR